MGPSQSLWAVVGSAALLLAVLATPVILACSEEIAVWWKNFWRELH